MALNLPSVQQTSHHDASGTTTDLRHLPRMNTGQLACGNYLPDASKQQGNVTAITPHTLPPPQTWQPIGNGHSTTEHARRVDADYQAHVQRHLTRPTTQSEQQVSLKPPFSYIALIAMAIESSPTRKLTVGEIYRYIRTRFPYYADNRNINILSWKNSVRHTLSLNDCFQKVAREHESKKKKRSSLWTIHPEARDLLQDGSLVRRTKRFKLPGPKQNIYNECNSFPGDPNNTQGALSGFAKEYNLLPGDPSTTQGENGFAKEYNLLPGDPSTTQGANGFDKEYNLLPDDSSNTQGANGFAKEYNLLPGDPSTTQGENGFAKEYNILPDDPSTTQEANRFDKEYNLLPGDPNNIGLASGFAKEYNVPHGDPQTLHRAMSQLASLPTETPKAPFVYVSGGGQHQYLTIHKQSIHTPDPGHFSEGWTVYENDSYPTDFM